MDEKKAAEDASADPGTVFAALAQIVYASDSFHDVFEALCRAAPQLVPGCDHASLMVNRNGRFLTAAASDDVARRIDETERGLDDGPCVDAIVEEAGQIDADLTDGSQWPRLADWVLEHTPVRGMAGYRLLVDDEKVGALNLYADVPGALTGPAADQATVFAAFASVALTAAARSETSAQLREGIRSNREIGKAVGLLMAFHKVDDEEAFAILRRTSQDLNIRLAEVAHEVVEHGRT